MGVVLKGSWFIYTLREIGGGASFELLDKGFKIWCAATSSSGTCVFERSCPTPSESLELRECHQRERQPRPLQIAFQRPGESNYNRHFLAQVVLTLDTD